MKKYIKKSWRYGKEFSLTSDSVGIIELTIVAIIIAPFVAISVLFGVCMKLGNFFIKVVGPLLLGCFIMGMILFTIVNLILGCDTWQQELWTAQNSCWYPLMPEWNPPGG